MALQRIFVGIDVSKDWLDVWIECLHQHHRFTNDDAGFKALLALTGTLSEPRGRFAGWAGLLVQT